MEYKKHEKQIVVRLDKGDHVMESLLAIAEKENIKSASITGLGAVDIANIAFFDIETKEYRTQQFNEMFEVLNLTGFLTQLDNKLHSHIHITLGRSDYSVIGGHLIEAQIGVTCEIVLNILDIPIHRQHDDELGIDTFGFLREVKRPSIS